MYNIPTLSAKDELILRRYENLGFAIVRQAAEDLCDSCESIKKDAREFLQTERANDLSKGLAIKLLEEHDREPKTFRKKISHAKAVLAGSLLSDWDEN